MLWKLFTLVLCPEGIETNALLAELIGLVNWATVFGSDYLEAKTREQIYIIEGHEFGF